MSDSFEEKIQARTYAEEHARAHARAFQEQRLEQKVAADAGQWARGLITVVIPLVLKYTPLLIVIGLVGSSLNLHVPELSSVKTHEFVSHWMTSWGLPDIPAIRHLLAWIWTGVSIASYAAFLPAAKVASAIGLDHLQKVGFAGGLAVCILAGIASLVVTMIIAALATSLMLAPVAWLMSAPVQKLRSGTVRSLGNWVLTIMSVWAFRETLRNTVAKHEAGLS